MCCISYIIYINMMNRILYSTGCAVFAPIPLADTRPCHLIVVKKERNIEACVIGDDFHINVIQCVCFVAMF